MRRASTTLDANIGLPPKFANLARGTIARRDSERAEHRDTEALLMSVLFRHQDLLEGKDALICEQEILSEADHRGLLDSLQMIVSVLSQQSWTEKDAKVTSRLSVAANRVGAIAGLHLHHSLEGAQTVDFRQYLDELCRERATMSLSDRLVVVDGIEVRLPPATGASLGLIVNELVTNAIEHGKGQITVTLEPRSGEGYALSVCNDGSTLPDGFDPAACSGLGLRLVSSLVAQIGGKLRFDRGEDDASTKVTVLFR